MSLFGIFKKKQEAPDRYAENPFLRLVDSFVLECIGELDAKASASLEQMTPKLQQTFNRSGTWQEIVMSQLDYGPEVRQAIKNMWVKNQEIARQNGTTLTPIQFTEMFVADNVLGA